MHEANGTDPVVSVVIPAYNRGDLLPRAVASVIGQTEGVLEIIIVDDHSDEDLAVKMRECADPRLRLVRMPRRSGAAAARNRGVAESAGDYIAFLDSDDAWLPRKLHLQLKVFERSTVPGLACVYTGIRQEEKGGVEVLEPANYRGNLLKPLLRHRNVVLGSFSTLLVRKDALLEVDGLDERLTSRQDYDLHVRMSLRGYAYDFVSEPMARCRLTGGDRISLDNGARIRGILRVFNKHKKVFTGYPDAGCLRDLAELGRRLAREGKIACAFRVYARLLAMSGRVPMRWTLRLMKEVAAGMGVLLYQGLRWRTRVIR